MTKTILDLFGGTGAWAKPYKDNGYNVITITLPDNDVHDFELPENVYGILAACPCTQFSIARNDKTALEPRNFAEGLKNYYRVLEIVQHYRLRTITKKDNCLKFWAIENPSSGYLKDFIGNPCFKFKPYEFGDKNTKETGLWGLFNNPIKTHEKDLLSFSEMRKGHSKNMSYIELIPEGYCKKTGYDTRKVLRSITPQGFANAFYKENK